MSYQDELKEIQRQHGGHLRPEDVVEFAKDPTTELHGRFDWDDTVAAERWRLVQARQIIRVVVTIIPNEHKQPIRVRSYVSLPSDRVNGGGYRALDDVLECDTRREEAWESLLAELRAIARKYAVFSSLTHELSFLDHAIEEILRLRRPSSGEAEDEAA